MSRDIGDGLGDQAMYKAGESCTHKHVVVVCIRFLWERRERRLLATKEAEETCLRHAKAEPRWEAL